MLFNETITVYSHNHVKPINSARKMHYYRLLKQAVHAATTKLERGNTFCPAFISAAGHPQN
jgi:hypothetical protein